MNEFKQAQSLYVKFLNGSQWLNEKRCKGENITKHLEDFKLRVEEPLERIWDKLAQEEKDYFLLLNKSKTEFGGEFKATLF